MITTSRMDKQGQLSVPDTIKEKLSLEPGSQVIWEENDRGDIILRTKKYRLKDAQDLLAGGPSIVLTDEELKEARQQYWEHRAKQS